MKGDAGSVDLSIIIPALNEAAIILSHVEEVQAYITKHMPTMAFEIIVVDDGSTDGMGALVAERAARDGQVRVVSHARNHGRGRAIRTGFAASKGKYIVCLDADLSYAPYHIPLLVEPLVRNEADITLASAYAPTGSVGNVPWSRAVLSRWGNRILSASAPGDLHTVTCIVRGYRREVIEQLELINDGKDLHLEVIQKAAMFRFRLKEVPAHLVWRDPDRKLRVKKTRWIDNIPFLAMSSTIASHLIYNYVLRPGSLLTMPIIILFVSAVVGSLMLAGSFVVRFATSPAALSFNKFYQVLRETLVSGSLTVALTLVAIIVSSIFLAFYFASQQSKKNFEETYMLLMRMNDRLKELERKSGN